MHPVILDILGRIMGAVVKFLPFLFAYRQGKKAVIADNTKEELEDAREAQEIRDAIDHSDITDLRNELRDGRKD